jgi:hypothetical protein
VAAWKHAARAELAADLQLVYAAVLSGLIKAFDRVPRERLVRQAGRYESNLSLFRLALAAYGLALVAGVFSACMLLCSLHRAESQLFGLWLEWSCDDS